MPSFRRSAARRTVVIAMLTAVLAGDGAGAQCTGDEVVRARCRRRAGAFTLVARLRRAAPGAAVTVCESGTRCAAATADVRGRVEVRWAAAAPGPHAVRADLPCGTTVRGDARCGPQLGWCPLDLDAYCEARWAQDCLDTIRKTCYPRAVAVTYNEFGCGESWEVTRCGCAPLDGSGPCGPIHPSFRPFCVGDFQCPLGGACVVAPTPPDGCDPSLANLTVTYACACG